MVEYIQHDNSTSIEEEQRKEKLQQNRRKRFAAIIAVLITNQVLIGIAIIMMLVEIGGFK